MDVQLTKKQIEILKELRKTKRQITSSEVDKFYSDYKGLHHIFC